MGIKKEKNKNIAVINTDFKKLMKYWLGFTQPVHRLTNQQQDILSMFLFHYFQYKQVIKGERLIWKMVFDYSTKTSIREELDIPDHTLQNNLSTLRKKNVITNNKINKNFIPNVEINANRYIISFIFNIKKNG